MNACSFGGAAASTPAGHKTPTVTLVGRARVAQVALVLAIHRAFGAFASRREDVVDIRRAWVHLASGMSA